MKEKNKQTVLDEKPVEKAKKSEDGKQKEAEKEAADKKIKELEDQVKSAKDDYLKLAAEFDTMKRRNAEDRLNLIKTASEDTIKEILPVLDACEQAVKMLENSVDEAAKEGTNLIFSKLMEALKKRGLAVVEAKGAKFDSDLHEAVAKFPAPSEDLKGMVIDVTRTGYSINGKIIRYPQVVVGD